MATDGNVGLDKYETPHRCRVSDAPRLLVRREREGRIREDEGACVSADLKDLLVAGAGYNLISYSFAPLLISWSGDIKASVKCGRALINKASGPGVWRRSAGACQAAAGWRLTEIMWVLAEPSEAFPDLCWWPAWIAPGPLSQTDTVSDILKSLISSSSTALLAERLILV